MINMLSPYDIYRLDINARWWGVPTELLMENAGRGVADTILEKFPNAKNIVIVASRTNNGGDGLVTARHLASKKNVTVAFIGYPELIKTKEAKTNWQYIEQAITIKKIIIKRREDLDKLAGTLHKADLVVDAIFGVGIRGEPKGLEAEAIRIVNEVKKEASYKIVSIDVPSGLDVYAGKPTNNIVRADLIVTFHDTKNGLDKVNAEVIVKNIGIPREAEIFVGPGDFLEVLRKRSPWSHKGDFGKILIVGGSKHYSGAPALAALAALRTGADLVTIYAPDKISNIIRGFSPNLIVESYKGENLGNANIDEIVELASNFHVIVVGPGIGKDEKTLKKAYEIIDELSRKHRVLVDADALKALAKYGIPSNILVTPHGGEFKIMFGETPPMDIEERSELARKYAQRFNITILLKGNIDIIANKNRTLFNKTGNPGMTVGGTGDVLTGIVATFWAQTSNSFLSAALGAFLSGYAGDMAYTKFGYQLLATDIINEIPNAIKRLRIFLYNE